MDMRHCIATIGAGLLLAGTSSAATLNVPADFPTIYEAISYANDGDQIAVAPGTYGGTSNSNKQITIQSTDGPEVTFLSSFSLSSQHSESVTLRGFTINGTVSVSGSNGLPEGRIYVDNCKIIAKNGNAVARGTEGVKLWLTDSTVQCIGNFTLLDLAGSRCYVYATNCTFRDSHQVAYLFTNSSAPSTFTNCNFINNERGITSLSPLEIYNCTFTGNGSQGEDGGAIYMNDLYEPALYVYDSTFDGNIGTNGGAIWANQSVIDNCMFINNSAVEKGGGICNEQTNGSIDVTNTTFEQCTAGTGGGVFTTTATPAYFQDCNFFNNSADSGSGIRLQSVNNCTISTCTFSGNTANFYGAGISLLASTAEVNNSTFCENTPDDIYGDGWTDNDNSFAQWCNGDCNENGVPDGQELKEGTATDCDGNDRLDECDIAEDPSLDCDGNGELDSCQVADDPSLDCTGDGLIDACQDLPDCNGNGAPDSCDIADGTSVDLNGDGVPDECKPDCNGNGIPDYIDIIFGASLDCDTNGVPDECQSDDCDGNGIPDSCDIADGTYEDVDGNGVPDVCQEDCNANGLPDDYEILEGLVDDCNDNGVPDSCDIDSGAATDCDMDGILDDCQYADDPDADCNDNGVYDVCDIADGTSNDWDTSGVPDECECLSDVTGDLLVNVTDLLNIIGEWNNTNSFADINRDGIVNVEDLLLVIGSWGPCP